MNRGNFWSILTLTAALIAGGCKGDNNSAVLDYDDQEQLALAAIIERDHPNATLQSDGYYIEPIDMSNKSGVATNADECWIRYNLETRSLFGDVYYTRTASVAKQQGTFNYYTRYAPTLQYLSLDEDTYVDVIDLVCQNIDITVDGAATNIYSGNHFNLYIPSEIHDCMVNGSGGYAGQTSLGVLLSVVSEVEITEVITDIELAQLDDMQYFIDQNMDGDNFWQEVSQYQVYEDDGETYFTYDYTDDDDDDIVVDYDETIYVYVNQGYTPSTKYNYTNPYPYEYLPDLVTSGFDNLEDQIVAALLSLEEDEDENYADDTFLIDDDTRIIDPESYCNVWYIARTLDGFIFDTNIIEVADIVFGDSSSAGSAISYSPSYATSSEYIGGWYFGLIELEYGQWGSILTNSAYAYGATGVDPGDTNAEIQPFTPLLFNVFIQAKDD